MTRGKWTSLQRVVERNSLNIAVEWHFSKEDLLWLSGFVTSFLLETWSLVMFLLELFLNFMVLKWPFPTFLFSGQKLWITRCWRQSKQTQTPSWTERSLTTARWGCRPLSHLTIQGLFDAVLKMKMYLNFFIIVLLSSSLVQLSKSNSHYHKIFKEISKDEQLRQSESLLIQTNHSTLNTEWSFRVWCH